MREPLLFGVPMGRDLSVLTQAEEELMFGTEKKAPEAVEALRKLILFAGTDALPLEDLSDLYVGARPFYVHELGGWKGFGAVLKGELPYWGCWPFNACEFYVDSDRGYKTRCAVFRKPRDPVEIKELS